MSRCRRRRGLAGGKKINGRKRFIVTDTLGLLIVVVVLAASVRDRDGAKTTLLSAYLIGPIRFVFADGGFAGKLVDSIDKSSFYVKTDFRHERRRLPRPDRAG